MYCNPTENLSALPGWFPDEIGHHFHFILFVYLPTMVDAKATFGVVLIDVLLVILPFALLVSTTF